METVYTCPPRSWAKSGHTSNVRSVKPAKFPYADKTHTDVVAVERSSNYVCVPRITDYHDKPFAATQRIRGKQRTRDEERMSKQEPTITLTENEDGWWTARNVEVGVSSQGETKQEALENLDEAVALYKGEIGREPTDEELREVGIEPEDNETGGELPDVLK